MSEEIKAEGSRYAHLDLLRLIACFLVVFNHTQGCIRLYEYDSIDFTVLVRLFIAMIVKINVPIFYMITGSLLLNRDRDYKDIFRRIAKMFAILLIFSIAAHLCYNKGNFYIPGFIRNFASATVDGAGPYWYLYAYLGILLILPFLRSIAVRMRPNDVFYLIVVRFVIGAAIPMLFKIANSVVDSNMHLALEFQPAIILVDCVFYPLIGYGLDRCLEGKEPSFFGRIPFAVMFAAADLLGILALIIAGPEEAFDGFVFLMVISVFMFVKKSVVKSRHRADKTISLLGSLTFGIYLLDPVIGPFFKQLFDFKGDHKQFWSSIAYCIFSMSVGGAITLLYKKVKTRILKTS
ncbi:MAG: acyltransferase [Butyrivibrio sp.]|nr:acyltransferase [Butyrivibrio sp.]